MVKKRSTTTAKISKPKSVDVRSAKDVKSFEGMMSSGPLTIVLVYADWCGHCQHFKNDMWDNASKIKNKNVNTASVHYDMLDKTSLANSKIEGYPSLLLVGTDKKPAEFKNGDGSSTNAMPSPNSPQEFEKMLTAPISSPVKNANSVANTITATASQPLNNVSVQLNNVSVPLNNVSLNSSVIKSSNSFTPSPPDTLTDLVESQGLDKQSGNQKGGNLLSALVSISQQVAPAGLLLAGASMRSKKSKRSKKTRKQRKHRKN